MSNSTITKTVLSGIDTNVQRYPSYHYPEVSENPYFLVLLSPASYVATDILWAILLASPSRCPPLISSTGAGGSSIHREARPMSAAHLDYKLQTTKKNIFSVVHISHISSKCYLLLQLHGLVHRVFYVLQKLVLTLEFLKVIRN